MIVLESCQVSSNQTVCLSMLTNGNCCFKTLEMNGMANLKLNLIEELIFLLSSQVFSFSMKGRQSLKRHTHLTLKSWEQNYSGKFFSPSL